MVLWKDWSTWQTSGGVNRAQTTESDRGRGSWARKQMPESESAGLPEGRARGEHREDRMKEQRGLQTTMRLDQALPAHGASGDGLWNARPGGRPGRKASPLGPPAQSLARAHTKAEHGPRPQAVGSYLLLAFLPLKGKILLEGPHCPPSLPQGHNFECWSY